MAKITKLPGQKIISGFRKVLDFYVYMGINCVRTWPRSPRLPRTQAVQAGWPAWSWASSNWLNLDQVVRDAYNDMARGTPKTGRDLFTQSYISTLYLELD